METRCSKELIIFELNWSPATPHRSCLEPQHGPCPGPLEGWESCAIHPVRQEASFSCQAGLWRGWRPAPSGIAAGTGLVAPGCAQMASWATGWVWGGPGRPGRDMSVLRIVTHTRSPCLSPQDYKNGIKAMIFCLYHIISSARPYFQGMGSTEDYGGFCSDAAWLPLFSFTRWPLLKLLSFTDASSQSCSCLNLLFHVFRCSLSSFWLDCLIHYSDSSNQRVLFSIRVESVPAHRKRLCQALSIPVSCYFFFFAC